MRGATHTTLRHTALRLISIHAPHARSDRHITPSVQRSSNFNPRSSCEERHHRPPQPDGIVIFQSTLLMRGATRPCFCFLSIKDISIHAPHARSDKVDIHVIPSPSGYFNPRSSCEERRAHSSLLRALIVFQSTLLMRGATPRPWRPRKKPCYFNPRSSCEERHCLLR